MNAPDFTFLSNYIIEHIPEDLINKLDESIIEQFFTTELAIIKVKKLVIDGIVICCFDETEELNYNIRYQLVALNIFLTEEETELLLELEKRYYEESFSMNTQISYHLERENWF